MAIGSITSGQNVGIGTSTPAARLHIEVPSGLTIPIMQVNKTGALSPYFIIDSSGKVGIGIATPSEALDVSGNIRFSGSLMPAGNAGTPGQVLISQGPGAPPQWTNASSIGDNWGNQVAQTQAPIVGDGTVGNPVALQSGSANGEVLIYNGSQWIIKQAPWDSLCNTALNNMVQKWTGSSLCNSQIYDDGTNVGIGTTTPTQKLDVAGNVQFSGALIPGGNAGSPGQVLVSQGPGVPPQWHTISVSGDNWGSQVAHTQSPIIGDGTAGSPITLQNGTSSGEIIIWDGTQWQIQQPSPSNGIAGICSSPTANYLQKWTSSGLCNSQIYDNGTNVGIGTASPTQKLDVVGNIAFSGSLMPGGNAGSPGQVLVSQGPGLPPVWQNIGYSSGTGSCVRGVTPCVNTSGSTGSCPGMGPSQCVNACKNSTYGGFTDWRVPTIEEYFCLKAEGYSFDNSTGFYWTVTPRSCANSTCLFPSNTGDWYVFKPSNGAWTWYTGNINNLCRCVR